MSRIKGKNTKPEITVRKYLFSNGFRYRLHSNHLPGKPDITLKKYRTVILINGCFWHGHEGCKYFKIPDTRSAWWKAKIEKTINKDRINISELEKSGWHTIIIWECDLRSPKRDITLNNLLLNLKALKNDTGY